MWYNSIFLKCPKEEEEEQEQEQEQEVPNNNSTSQYVNTTSTTQFNEEEEEVVMDDFEGILGIDEKKMLHGTQLISWDLIDWEEGFKVEYNKSSSSSNLTFEEEEITMVKNEIYGFCDFDDQDDDENRLCLNLNLNYDKVLDAWSDRGLPWTVDDEMGEVPMIMEEDRTRREASVLRYKEKRQSRLFSKKIRYQVRKFNADNRPRLKGRFVKRNVS
ncbi:hypothetical protein ACFE04_011819 [Oxalis oulophora]